MLPHMDVELWFLAYGHLQRSDFLGGPHPRARRKTRHPQQIREVLFFWVLKGDNEKKNPNKSKLCGSKGKK